MRNSAKLFNILDMTKGELELIPDGEINLFFKKGMRGRVSYISKRYSKAKNKYLKSYELKQEWKHIIYIDANDLNGYAMSNFRPISGFKWIVPKDFKKYSSNSKKGRVLENDLEYHK